MSPDDILEYASVAVGFPVKPGQLIKVLEQCYGRAEENGFDYVSPVGATAIIESVEMKPNPQQLTIEISILVDEELGIYIHDLFDEDGVDPHFPFTQIKTQEDVEIERSEQKGNEPLLPKPLVNSPNSDWIAYNDQQERLARERDEESVKDTPKPPDQDSTRDVWADYWESSFG